MATTNEATKTKVRDWMTKDPITIDADASVVQALHLLKEKNVRRLPVMKGGKLVGLVTERMLLTFSPGKSTALDTWEVHYLLARTPVTAAMNPKPHTIGPDTDLADCAQIIHDRKLNGITVVNEHGDLVGILTTTNALEALIWFTRQARDAGR
jgi:acetoin utilization protein AcuB